ncbi:hypothetical protein JW921_05360, partial [Candidatus Fermentibacterales bacterium]|nr:hypothetical protein [Candidatus Fermentibacterales bacterium]
MSIAGRPGKIRFVLSVALPISLPVVVLVLWLASQVRGQLNQPTQIVASMSSDGSGRTYLSTVLPDGNQAVWTCSTGSFLESGSSDADGRSVTWLPQEGLADSVKVTVSTPSASDSISFLPIAPSVLPRITVSPAYHLALLEQSRRISLQAGVYTAILEAEGIEGYDGLVLLVCHVPGTGRVARTAFPGDTLAFRFPLGAEIEAVAMDDMEGALDNTGRIVITF